MPQHRGQGDQDQTRTVEPKYKAADADWKGCFTNIQYQGYNSQQRTSCAKQVGCSWISVPKITHIHIQEELAKPDGKG